MIARYNNDGEFTHFEHPEDQQFSPLDRAQYQRDNEDCNYN